jgi:hypothetical protein
MAMASTLWGFVPVLFCLYIQIMSLKSFRHQTRTFENMLFLTCIRRIYSAVFLCAIVMVLTQIAYLLMELGLSGSAPLLFTADDILNCFAPVSEVFLVLSTVATHAALVHACSASSPSAVRRVLRAITVGVRLIVACFLAVAGYAAYLAVITFPLRSEEDIYPITDDYIRCNRFFRRYIPGATCAVDVLCLLAHVVFRLLSRRSRSRAQPPADSSLAPPLPAARTAHHGDLRQTQAHVSLNQTLGRFALTASVTLPLVTLNDLLVLWFYQLPLIFSGRWKYLLVFINFFSELTVAALGVILLTFGYSMAEAVANAFAPVCYATQFSGKLQLHFCWPWRRSKIQLDDLLPTWDSTPTPAGASFVDNPMQLMSSAPDSMLYY